jgi:hypothetical protein
MKMESWRMGWCRSIIQVVGCLNSHRKEIVLIASTLPER